MALQGCSSPFPVFKKLPQKDMYGDDCSAKKIKYIFVTGGVISSVGKGLTTSFLGALMKGCGYAVTAIKIDPYLNIDAGTFSPYEHGEVFVLDDGAEVDLDLGNYERILDIRLTATNNITTGKIYDLVIRKERQGLFLGKTVQIIPHITDAIQEWIEKASRVPVDDTGCADLCLVEIGGVVGDIENMPFLEAIRQFQRKVRREDYCHVHVSLLPETVGGELKTKPTQASVRQMRSLGLSPDFIVCRCSHEIDIDIRRKISQFCDVGVEEIISLPNLKDTHQVMAKLFHQNMVGLLCERLCLAHPLNETPPLVGKWLDFANRNSHATKEVRIAVVGKYTKHLDAYHSIAAALFHAAIAFDRKLVINWVFADDLEESQGDSEPEKFALAWAQVRDSHGLVIPGGFDRRGIGGKVLAVNYARTERKPILGICLGLQVMVIEYARSVLGLADANSTEMDPDTLFPVVVEMPEFNPEQKGGTMRLGLRRTTFLSTDCLTFRLYGGVEHIQERHRHRFEVNLSFRQDLERAGIRFVGQDDTGQRMEILELPVSSHPYFVGVQYHPEFLSRPLVPAPVFAGLLGAALAWRPS